MNSQPAKRLFVFFVLCSFLENSTAQNRAQDHNSSRSNKSSSLALPNVWTFGVSALSNMPLQKNGVDGFRGTSVGSKIYGKYFFGNIGLGLSAGILPGTISSASMNSFLAERKFQQVEVTKSNPFNSFFLFGPSARFGKRVFINAEIQAGFSLNNPGAINISQPGALRALYAFSAGEKNLFPAFSVSISLAYPISSSTNFVIHTDYLQTKSSILLYDPQRGIDVAREQERKVKIMSVGVGVSKTFQSTADRGNSSRNAASIASPQYHAINTKGTGATNGRIISAAERHAINTQGTGATNGRMMSNESCGRVTQKTTNPDGSTEEKIFACPADAAAYDNDRKSTVGKQTQGATFGEKVNAGLHAAGAAMQQGNATGIIAGTVSWGNSNSYGIITNQALSSGSLANAASPAAQESYARTLAGSSSTSNPGPVASIYTRDAASGLATGRRSKKDATTGQSTGRRQYAPIFSDGQNQDCNNCTATVKLVAHEAAHVVQQSQSLSHNNPMFQQSGNAGENPLFEASGSQGNNPTFHASGTSGTNPLYEASGSQGSNPMYQANGTSGTNPLYEGSRNQGNNPLYQQANKMQNNDGSGCEGIEGLFVALLNATNGSVVATTTTGSCGHFFFANVPEANYVVQVSGAVSKTKKYEVNINSSAAQDLAGALKTADDHFTITLNTLTNTGTSVPLAGGDPSMLSKSVTKTRTKSNNSNDRMASSEPEEEVGTTQSFVKKLPVLTGDFDGDGSLEILVGSENESYLRSGSLPGGSLKMPGDPIPGLDVKLGKNPGGSSMQTSSNTYGEFEFTNLQKGNYTLSTTAIYNLHDQTFVALGDDISAYRKGWDGTVKGGSVIANEPGNKGIQENGIKKNADENSRKGWDGTVKGGSKAQDHNSTRSNKTASQIDNVIDSTGDKNNRKGWDGTVKGGSKAQDHNSTRSNKTASQIKADEDAIQKDFLLSLNELDKLLADDETGSKVIEQAKANSRQLRTLLGKQNIGDATANVEESFLRLQNSVASLGSAYQSISNVLKTKHDTAKNSVGNIR